MKKMAEVEYIKYLWEKEASTASSYNNLAALYYNQGKYEEAEPLYIKSLKIIEEVLGTNHPNTKVIRKNLEYQILNVGY